MADFDLESGENREEVRRADLQQRRADNRRHGAGVRHIRITREKGIFILGTAKKTAADHFVQLVGLLGTFYTIMFGFLQVEGKTNPFRRAIFLVALCICALAVGFRIIVRNMFGNRAADHTINRAILISGALGIVTIVSVMLPDWVSCTIYVIWAICSLMGMAWNRIKQWRLFQRTENALFGVLKKGFLINGGRKLVEPKGPNNV